ncbi:hypothetical protein AAW51_5287 [Caldimonas brevitalea]|uniref:Uncharacterized protein n=2 Tax=Caldimonas brevitalea TaxID=413882 RepID=A0A0G3BVC1_9BURK|nr:hypothetical protein AAW51_5287 [Caldimonas brevitalea]
MSRCFAQAFPETAVKDDANDTASGYLEYGNQPIEAYNELDILVGKYVARKYAGVAKSDFNTMKCIDLFHSKELDQLASKLAKSGGKSKAP